MADQASKRNGEKQNGTFRFPDAPRTILVADDEHLVATGLVNALKDLGYEVCGPVSDGVKAIALCQQEEPDLALLDIRMPKMDGLAAAECIYPQFGIPVVIVSAYSDQEYIQSGNRVGVFGYLLKPVTPEQLRAGLEIAWGRFVEAAKKDEEIGLLKDRLEARKSIEQAKWIIVEKHKVREDEAMRMLQRQARNTRRPLVDVARELLEKNEKKVP